MRKLFFALYSLSCLKTSQLFYLAFYRLWGFNRVADAVLPGSFQSELVCRLFPHPHQIIDPDRRIVRLLNKSFQLTQQKLDWTPIGFSRLWLYHLHYFDFLHQSHLTGAFKAEWIDDWIEQNPQGARPAWEPYTISLRIVNWIGYFVGRQVPPHWNQSLYTQARWLRANLELHILANHYFENIKALLFAALYFDNLKDAKQEVNDWKDFALEQLQKQLQEQFLPDGGHYERSPMYHNIMMKNCLELLAVLRGQGEKELCLQLERVVQNGLTLATNIARPDGAIPLLNDSVLDHAPDAAALLVFAKDLQLIDWPPSTTKNSEELILVQAHDTGIYGVKVRSDWLMMDCGDIGPQYQPGHTHCDLLSYELMLGGFPLVVDSGVYEYDVGAMRHQLRSTSAHNTLQVDHLEQSEIWSAFRVARRAKKIQASIERERNLIQIRGAYRGFYRGLNSSIHSREMGVVLDAQESRMRQVHVHDEVVHRRQSRRGSVGFIHLHPEVSLETRGKFQYDLRVKDLVVARIHVEHAAEVSLSPSVYAPEFGLQLVCQKLSIKSHNNCIAYSIHSLLED